MLVVARMFVSKSAISSKKTAFTDRHGGLERCALEISPPVPIYETVVGRSWCHFDANAFRSELLASDLCADINTRGALKPDDLLNLFQSTTTKLIDKYASVKTKKRGVRNTNVWFNEECRQAKKKTR